jgi:hypothetical protein
MRRYAFLVAILALSGCASPQSLVTVHVDEDWAVPGVYAVDSGLLRGLLQEWVKPYSNEVWEIEWKSQPSLTIQHDGRTFDMFSSEPGSRSLSFINEQQERMIFLGGECILGCQLRKRIRPRPKSTSSQQPPAGDVLRAAPEE